MGKQGARRQDEETRRLERGSHVVQGRRTQYTDSAKEGPRAALKLAENLCRRNPKKGSSNIKKRGRKMTTSARFLKGNQTTASTGKVCVGGCWV